MTDCPKAIPTNRQRLLRCLEGADNSLSIFSSNVRYYLGMTRILVLAASLVLVGERVSKNHVIVALACLHDARRENEKLVSVIAICLTLSKSTTTLTHLESL